MTLSRQRSDIGVRLSERRSGKGDKSDFLRQRQTQPVHHCSSGAVLLTLLRSWPLRPPSVFPSFLVFFGLSSRARFHCCRGSSGGRLAI